MHLRAYVRRHNWASWYLQTRLVSGAMEREVRRESFERKRSAAFGRNFPVQVQRLFIVH
jgi:hypothetical protein